MRAKLETSNGEAVTTAVLPPFRMLPFVLVWGGRVFHLAEAHLEGPPVYRECFSFVVAETTSE